MKRILNFSFKKILYISILVVLISALVWFLPLIYIPSNKCENVSFLETFNVQAMSPPYGYYAKLGISKEHSKGKTITLCLVLSSDYEETYNIDVEFNLPNGILLKKGALKQRALFKKEQTYAIEVEIKDPARYVLSGGMVSKEFSAYDEAVLDALAENVTFYEAWGKGWSGKYQRVPASGKQMPPNYLPNLYPEFQWQPVVADPEVWYTSDKRDLNVTDGYSSYSEPNENLSESQISSFMNYYHNNLTNLGWKKVYANKSLFNSSRPSEDYVYQKNDYYIHFGINFNPYSNPNQFYVKRN